jgi:hypothetical protein
MFQMRSLIGPTCGAALLIAILVLPARADLVVERVNVISMLPGQGVQTNMDVLIREGRIVSIAPASEAAPYSGDIQRIDGQGRWLMPALVDMHVHLESDRLLRLYLNDPRIPDGTVNLAQALLPYVANGVLQIAVLSATEDTIAQRDAVERGDVLGPHMALAGMIDGAEPVWPIGMTRVAATPEEGREVVRQLAAEGYNFVKAYERLDSETFVAICDEARRLNLKVIGHLPGDGSSATKRLLVPGLSMIAHAEEIAQQKSPPDVSHIAQYVQWMKDNGTWLTSTLTVDDRILQMMSEPDTLQSRPELNYLLPQLRQLAVEANPYVRGANPDWMEHVRRVVEFNRKLIPALVAAGVPIVAGSDSLVPGIVPGFSLHDELQALVDAGLSNRQAIESATRLPAHWLGVSEDRGVVAVGKRANLLLLERSPLERIEHTRSIAAVIVQGEFYSRDELDKRMEELKAR